ncbi:MAG: NAD-dependent epimerase/dehydratase family protein, partial [Phycicoccus sp.]
DVARHVAGGSPHDREPQVTGRYRIGDVRHVVASPARACRELGFAAQVRPADGLARFATAPLRA